MFRTITTDMRSPFDSGMIVLLRQRPPLIEI
jgi:hypothetical protein